MVSITTDTDPQYSVEPQREHRMIDDLLWVAEVMKELGFNPAYCSVIRDSQGGVRVGLFDSDFRKLFKGQTLVGERRGSSILFQATKLGLLFEASVYEPLPTDGSVERLF